MRAVLFDIVLVISAIIAAGFSIAVARNPNTSWGKRISLPIAIFFGLGLLYYTAQTGRDPTHDLSCGLFPNTTHCKRVANDAKLDSTQPNTAAPGLSWPSLTLAELGFEWPAAIRLPLPPPRPVIPSFLEDLPTRDPHQRSTVGIPRGPIDGNWWPIYEELSLHLGVSEEDTWTKWQNQFPGSCQILTRYDLTYGQTNPRDAELHAMLDSRAVRQTRVTTPAPQHHGPYLARRTIEAGSAIEACAVMSETLTTEANEVCRTDADKMLTWRNSGRLKGLDSLISRDKCQCLPQSRGSRTYICRSRVEFICNIDVIRDMTLERCAG